MKTCSKCKVEKNPGEFARDKAKKDGRCPQCKTCRRQYCKDNAKALTAQRKIYKSRPENRFRTYQASAKVRGFEWKLSYKEFMEFWQVDCVWCGVSMPSHLNIGLDRVNPAKPYEAGNIESCCAGCNRMKSDMTADDFEGHIGKIFNFRNNQGDN